ncbi:MAG: hypothetical protein AAF654_12025 [Myxococcota bacterium]
MTWLTLLIASAGTESFSYETLINTEVAHFVIFHPADLKHANEWPIAWYAEPFVFPAESGKERLVAWSTRSDGVFKVRLTDGPLTTREKRYLGPSWTFPYTVRHGAVYLDDTDLLPGKEQMSKEADRTEYRFAVPNGRYNVTVQAIEWFAEPGSDARGFNTVPSYVVRFAKRAGRTPKLARTPPRLLMKIGAKADDTPPPRRPAVRESWKEDLEGWEIPVPDFKSPLPAARSASVLPAGLHFHSKKESLLTDYVGWKDLMNHVFVVAPKVERGALGVLVRLAGASRNGRYEYRSLLPVRIKRVVGSYKDGKRSKAPAGDLGVAAVICEPLSVPGGKVTSSKVSALARRAAAILAETKGAWAETLGGEVGYRALQVGFISNGEELSDFLLRYYPIEPEKRLELGLLPLPRRLSELSKILGH